MDKGEAQLIMACRQGLAADREALQNVDKPRWPAATATRVWQRVQRRYPQALSLIGLQELQQLGRFDGDSQSAWAQLHQQVMSTGLDAPSALRVMRQITVAQLSAHDQLGQLPLACVTQVMTGFAEFCLAVAVQGVSQELEQRHGKPLGASGQVMPLWIVGMGKLGGRELNVSSDIDLVYLYEADGEVQTSGISHHEWFTKAAKGLQRWLADVTEHGFVFRVDLALRPHGLSGPVVGSLAALRDYLLGQGREWERLAWMKSRVICPALDTHQAQAIRDLVTPFVYRRYLDYSVFDALRDLHGQIRAQANKRAVGRPNRAHDVKLGRGGIREIEFLVQCQQIVRGGQFPELRTRSTLKGLHKLAQAGLLDAQTAQRLAAAYTWLRQVEHRIQYQDDAQTHELPSNDADLAHIAQAMGCDTACDLLCQLDEVRETVAMAFDAHLGSTATPGKCKGCNCADAPIDTSPESPAGLDKAPNKGSRPTDSSPGNLPDLAQRLADLQQSPKLAKLKPRDAERLQQLLGQTRAMATKGQCSELAAVRMVDWLGSLLQREGYLALLVERPTAAQRVLRLLGSSTWAVHYLRQFPSVVDELAQVSWIDGRFDAKQFQQELETRRAALALGREDDDEALMNLLRRAHHAQVFRTLARDLEGRLTVEQVADDLSALADAVLATSLIWIWQGWWTSTSPKAHRERPQLAVMAYGKLGGKELGYGSDLDLVFVHNDPHERAQECYALLAKRLINWMGTKTALGDLYEIDTALRPNGNSGLLVTHMEAFENYQAQRGGNAAWTWEHQAITRARAVLGPADLVQRIDQTRKQVLCAPRDAAALRSEIANMRQRVAQAHPVAAGQFDPKHSPGGMLDCEFAVQTLVLLHAQGDPVLQGNPGNIALLQAADGRWLPKGVGQAAAHAYRRLRAHQHALRLAQQQSSPASFDWDADLASVAALWQALGLARSGV